MTGRGREVPSTVTKITADRRVSQLVFKAAS